MWPNTLGISLTLIEWNGDKFTTLENKFNMPFNEGHDRLELGANKWIQRMVILFVCKQHTYGLLYNPCSQGIFELYSF